MCDRRFRSGPTVVLALLCASLASSVVWGDALENGSFTLSFEGRQIHYEVHGSGPVLMTVPNSWGLSLEGLRGMYRPLESHVTMIYFDPRGMGGSGPVTTDEDMGMEAVRADFHAVREHLGLDRVNAIGWSNGAMNLIWLAAERPETLTSAIFLHGAASFSAEDMEDFAATEPELMQRWQAVAVALAAEGLSDGERSARQGEFWLNEYFPAAQADPKATAETLKKAFAQAEFSYRHARFTEEAYPEFDARDALDRITVPSLVIAGAGDMLRPEKVEELAKGLPEAHFVLFERSGHFAPVEEPERFRSTIIDFLGPPPTGSTKVTYVANEGFLVETAGAKILFDAVFYDPSINWCHKPDAEMRAALEKAQPPFDGVDLILVTHWHIDHFDPAMVLRHLESNPEATVVGSPQVVTKLREQPGWNELVEAQVRELDLELFESAETKVGGIRLVSHRIRHGRYMIPDGTTAGSRNKHEQVENLAYVVKVDGVRIAHFGDAFLRENEELFDGRRFPKQKVDLLFHEGWSEPSLALAQEWMSPDRIIFMHMPADPERLDRTYRFLTETIPDAVVFREPMESRSFPARPR